MKKLILFAAILFAGVSMVKAEGTPTGPTATDKVTTLNVKLNPIQTLFVNPSQKTVDLEYSTVDHYKDGVTSTQVDHLKIYSTGAFVVQVASSDNQIKRADGTETINSSDLKVLAAYGSSNALSGANMEQVGLSTTATDLIASLTGGVNMNFNVTYSGLGGDGYVNKYFNAENPTVYSTTVTYSIVAR